jgi:hypothetical protein
VVGFNGAYFQVRSAAYPDTVAGSQRVDYAKIRVAS